MDRIEYLIRTKCSQFSLYRFEFEPSRLTCMFSRNSRYLVSVESPVRKKASPCRPQHGFYLMLHMYPTSVSVTCIVTDLPWLMLLRLRPRGFEYVYGGVIRTDTTNVPALRFYDKGNLVRQTLAVFVPDLILL